MALTDGRNSYCLWELLFVASLLLFPVLYLSSRIFKYYVKLGVFYISSLLIGFGAIFYGFPRPRNPRNHSFVAFCVRNALRPALGMEVTVRGAEHLQTHQSYILVLNHQSSIDMIPLFMIWPDNCVSIAKRELILYSGTFGLGAWMCGTVYIDRLNSDKARKTIEETAQLIKQKNLRIVIFPEGTRNHAGSMLPFKKGAFHLAVQAQVPVVPVVVSSYYPFYSQKEKRFDEGRVLVEVLPPISTSGLVALDVSTLTEKTRNLMLECFTKISQEVNVIK